MGSVICYCTSRRIKESKSAILYLPLRRKLLKVVCEKANTEENNLNVEVTKYIIPVFRRRTF